LRNKIFTVLEDKLLLPALTPTAKMGVEVKTVQAGDGVNKPVKGDTVSLWYRGYLFAEQTPENKGNV
jgi:hypothetical protein